MRLNRTAVSRLRKRIARLLAENTQKNDVTLAAALLSGGFAAYSVYKHQDCDHRCLSLKPQLLTVAACDNWVGNQDHIPPGYSEPEAFRQCVEYHRSLLQEYRHRWNYANPESRTPTSALWPRAIPSAEDVPALERDLMYCKRSPNYRSDEAYCDNLQFRLAAYYVHCHDDIELQKKGFKSIKDLAERGHPDGMCFYGMILNDGIVASVEADPTQATVWFRRSVDMHKHIPSVYEFAVALYTGEGIAENEDLAVYFFRMAADTGHAGAAYMLGDCLLDGIGCDRDRAEALDWLVNAAELGHRGARSRVMAVLEMQDGDEYGKFTDASRQTLVSDVADRKNEIVKWSGDENGDSNARTVSIERRFTIGGGAKNPAILARRKTVVEESRHS